MTVPLWLHCWHFLAGLFSRRVREQTPREALLAGEVTQLTADLADARTALAVSQTEREKLASVIVVKGVEIEHLLAVNQRNLARVHSEEAMYHAQAAHFAVPRNGGQ